VRLLVASLATLYRTVFLAELFNPPPYADSLVLPVIPKREERERIENGRIVRGSTWCESVNRSDYSRYSRDGRRKNYQKCQCIPDTRRTMQICNPRLAAYLGTYTSERRVACTESLKLLLLVPRMPSKTGVLRCSIS